MYTPLQQGRNEPHERWLARNLLLMLRHRATASGLHTDPGGWARISDLLQLPAMKDLTEHDINRLAANRVEGCFNKFEVEYPPGGYPEVRAFQGHTMSHLRPEAVGSRILAADVQARTIVHCTRAMLWDAGTLDGGLVSGVCTGQSPHALIYMTTNYERFLRKDRRGCRQVAILLDTADMHQHGLALFRTNTGDVICHGPIPASCYISASKNEGLAPVEIWHRRQGPPATGRPAQAAPPSTGGQSAGPIGGRTPQAERQLLQRFRGIQWGPTQGAGRGRRRRRAGQQAQASGPQRTQPTNAPPHAPGPAAALRDAPRRGRSPAAPGRGASRDSRRSDAQASEGRGDSPLPARRERSGSRSRSPGRPQERIDSDHVLWFAVPHRLLIGNLEYVLSPRSLDYARSAAARAPGRAARSPSRPARVVRERQPSMNPASAGAPRRRSADRESSTE